MTAMIASDWWAGGPADAADRGAQTLHRRAGEGEGLLFRKAQGH